MNRIIKLCIDIFAHDQLDWEITLGGNGANAFECSFVAHELLEILDMTYEEIEPQIKERVLELQEW